MKKTHTLAKGVLTFVLLAGTPMAFAETAGTMAGGSTATGTRQAHMEQMRKEMQDKKGEMGKMMDNHTASTTRPDMRPKMEDHRGEIEQKRNEMKNDMQGRMANMMKKQGERVIARLESALGRLTNIADRIDSRITKLGEKGVNTTKAKADLAIAKTKIDATKVKLDAAKTAIAGILADTGTVATSTPGMMMSGKIMLIKEQVQGVEVALKDAHKALVVATTDLKGKSDTATTTTPGTD